MPVVPGPSASPSTDYYFELRTSPALVMGPGTPYEVMQVEGLDLPPLRVTDVARASADGSFRGRDYKGVRTVVLTVEITGTPGTDLANKMTTFATAWNSRQADVDFIYRLPGTSDRKVVGTPRRCGWRVEQRFSYGIVEAACEFVCNDPRIFDAATSAEVLF